MKRTWLWLHFGAVLIAIGLIAIQFIFPTSVGHTSTNGDASETPITVQLAALLFGYSFISGVVLMARRKGDSESFLLAVSTLTPFVLFFVLVFVSYLSNR
jgi:hypothetical protein